VESKRVLVIGGGLGSLAASIRLAKLGFNVSLFEKNPKLGGKMNEHQQEGFQWDTGPSLLTMTFILDELFEFAGENRSDYLNFSSLEPLCRYFFADHTQLDASSNLTRMQSALKNFSSDEPKAYLDFIQYSRKIFETAAEIFLFGPIHEIKKLIRPANLSLLTHIHRIDPFRKVNQAVKSFFNDPRLVQLFNRYATYNGSDPFQAPATLNIIPYVENELGGFYIQGGMYRLVEALEKVAKKLGVELYTSTRVEKIKQLNGKITGLMIAGEFIPADYVVCGADVVESFNTLLDNHSDQRQKLNDLEPSLSGMIFLWGVNRTFPELAHHNIIFSRDYELEFSQIFKEFRAPDDPTIYIAISSKSDPIHAPAGCENWFVLLNMPYLQQGQDWEKEKERMKEIVLRKLQEFNLDISGNIVTEKAITPADFYELYASNRGSIYGLSSNSRLTAFRRPANRSRLIHGLYFAGGSTHPGGGIPLVLLSGKISAELIAEKEGRYRSDPTRLTKHLENHLQSITRILN